MATKFDIKFDEFKKIEEKLRELAGMDGVIKATENALTATGDYVTAEIDKAVENSPYNFNRTGKTKASIERNREVKWDGTEASIDVGFRISEGGLPAIFLMYGAPSKGSTRKNRGKVEPDTNLYNAAKGKGKHEKVIRDIQQTEFNKIIRGAMNND